MAYPISSTLDRVSPGLLAGGVGVAIVVAIAVVARRRAQRTPLPVAGLVLVATALVALDHVSGSLVSRRLLIGLTLLAVGPVLASTLLPAARFRAALVALTAVPGALVVADAAALTNQASWIRPALVVTTVIGGALAADTDGVSAEAGLGPVLLAGAAVAMFTTLPDTEQAGAIAGAAVWIALLGFPVAWASLGPGVFCAVGLLGWEAAVGGVGRAGSVVGALACFGLLLVEPVVRLAWRGRARLPRHPVQGRTVAVIVVQAVTVVLLARVAGFRDSAASAAVIALVVLVGAAGALACITAPATTSDRNDPEARAS